MLLLIVYLDLSNIDNFQNFQNFPKIGLKKVYKKNRRIRNFSTLHIK